jgi:tripartite-type tricarboxylate transporter receptor subunit TctC
VSTSKRNPQLPDVPTTGEAGVSGADSPLWFGVWAPAGTPADIVAKISADTRKALSDPGVREKLTNLGNDTMDMSPEEFARFVRSEIDDYARVIRTAGIQPQ